MQKYYTADVQSLERLYNPDHLQIFKSHLAI